MDWQNALWIAGFALLFWMMMRGCGGMGGRMSGGGCGMGGKQPDADARGTDAAPTDDKPRDRHRAA